MRDFNTSRDGRPERSWRAQFLLAQLLPAQFLMMVFMLFCAAGAAHALDPAREASQYIRNRWTIDNGFPGGQISSIAQTGDGYLWIGTDRGLVRFDGINFVPVQ